MNITISSINEETCCNFCGEPLHLGDPAHFGNDLEYYCTENCARHNAHRSDLNRLAIQYITGKISREKMIEEATDINLHYA